MPEFQCKVVTAEGVILDRTLSGDSVDAVYSILKERKEQLISIKKKGLSLDLGKVFEKYKKVNPKDMAIFTNQLKVMLRTGIPITKCLETLERQASSESFEAVIKNMYKNVIGGQSLSEAMSNHPNAFSNLYVSMVKAGEETGKIDDVLEQLEIFTEIEISTKSSVKKALRYPMIVMSVVVVAGFIAMTQVIPSFTSIFTQYGGELPTLTKILMAVSDFLTAYALIIIVVFIGIVFGVKSYIRTPGGAFQWDRLKLKLPIVKGVLITSSMARFSLIMKTLLASGLQIVDALDIAKRTVGNLVYEKEIGRAKDLIVGGVPINKALESEYIPDITNNMIAIGEETGSVTTMLGTVSDYFMVELKDKLDALSAAIEPLVTVVLGLFIGVFVASIFVPMFKMVSLVGNP
tara:strand:- start:16745 stop:17959 length:1215 start_codon:yes stop_codon:yes gene_type:complete